MSGALYFADREMKMADNCFRGFPALWNVAAFYLLLVRPDPRRIAELIGSSGRAVAPQPAAPLGEILRREGVAAALIAAPPARRAPRPHAPRA